MDSSNQTNCLPQEIKLKSNFLGPKSENGDWLEKNVCHIFSHWCEWRRTRFPRDGRSISLKDHELKEYQDFQQSIFNLQKELSILFENEVPKYSPRYMGHMVSEISLPALFGHLIALIHNPNNSNFCSSKVGLNIEKEAITFLSQMIGYAGEGVGHFTSGGTVANIEGLWRARYRLDHNLALGAYLTHNKLESMSLFEAAHLGNDKHKLLTNKYQANPTDVKKYSFVVSGPYVIANIYNEVFSTEFQGPVLIIPSHKHYSWQKAMTLMGLSEDSLWPVAIDESGHLCLDDLERKINLAMKNDRPILAVVSVTGTTELGMVDPVNKVQDLLDNYKKNHSIHIWHHVDGAYGGIYSSLLRGQQEGQSLLKTETLESLNALHRVESITLDPHKLAMVPYSCGAIIVKDQECNLISEFAAPYLQESTENSGKWSSTIEGSRSATGACATWMVAKSLGLNCSGIGAILSLGLLAKQKLESLLIESHPYVRIIPESDTNIVAFTFSKKDEKISISNQRVEKIYKDIMNEDEFSISKTTILKSSYGKFLTSWAKSWNANLDTSDIVLIRMVLMNPFTVSKENDFNYLREFSVYISKLALKYEDIS